MACNNNGQTYVDTCIPAPGATATDATYVVDLTHYTCGNRKICINGAYPITADLNYRVLGTPQLVGNETYQCDILITGTCTYMPYVSGQNQCGCGCNVCPQTENLWATVSVPVSSSTIPTVTKGAAVASPTNVKDCCSVTNAVSIVDSFNLTTTQTGA
jgi:hypothetical protein